MIPYFAPDTETWFFKKQTKPPSPLYPFMQFGNILNFDINSLIFCLSQLNSTLICTTKPPKLTANALKVSEISLNSFLLMKNWKWFSLSPEVRWKQTIYFNYHLKPTTLKVYISSSREYAEQHDVLQEPVIYIRLFWNLPVFIWSCDCNMIDRQPAYLEKSDKIINENTGFLKTYV